MAWYWFLAGAAICVAAGAIVGRWRTRSASKPRRAPRVARATDPDNPAMRYSLPILMGGGVVAILAFGVAYRMTDGADKDRVEVGVRGATAILAATAGILTWGRLDLSRSEHRLAVDRDLTERYGRAAEQLGSADPLIRAAGAFALERFALDAFALGGHENNVDWQMALDLLVEFVRRDRQPITAPNGTTPQGETPGPVEGSPATTIPIDVMAALRAVSRFNSRSNTADPISLRLSGLNLAGAELAGADLRNADLTGADLTDANLSQADLSGAVLTNAKLYATNLDRAVMVGAALNPANLTYAEVTNANLVGADLGNANLDRANLENSDLRHANLRSASAPSVNFTDADLTHAVLSKARLTGNSFRRTSIRFANLTQAKLASAEFMDADLTGADLSGADLAGAEVTRANFARANLTHTEFAGASGTACWDDETVWPDGSHTMPSLPCFTK